MTESEHGDSSTDPSSGDAGSEGTVPEDPDVGIEDAVSELERVEGKRRLGGVFAGIGAIVAVLGGIILAAEYKSCLFQPRMPVEKNERKIIRKTDDPECRELIDEVTEIGNQYYVLESEIEETIPGDDPEAIRNLDEKLVTLRNRLEEAEAFSHEANLRYEKSREELDKWFSYTTYEIDILRDVIDNQLAELTPADAGTSQRDAGAAEVDTDGGVPDAGRRDAGDVGAAREEPSFPYSDERTPTERRDGAMVELHEAFENFRVWHSGDSQKHPCGDDEEGEEPWRPDDWDAGIEMDGKAPGG